MVICPLSFIELEELFPINSPELGTGANASNFGGSAGPKVHPSLGEGKNEDILGAATCGKTAGEAVIVDAVVRVSTLAKKMAIDIPAKNFVIVAI